MEDRVEVTDEVMEALGRAQDEARALGHGYVGTEHMLIAFSQMACRGAEGLRAQGVTVDALRAELRRLFDENTWNRYVPDEESLAAVGIDLAAIRAKAEAEFGEGALPMKGPRGVTRRLHTLVTGVSEEVHRARGEPATVDDVFAALVEDEESIGVKMLRRAGADLAALRAAL